MHAITIERIEDGRIAEVWVARDELGLLRQVGVLPEQRSPVVIAADRESSRDGREVRR